MRRGFLILSLLCVSVVNIAIRADVQLRERPRANTFVAHLASDPVAGRLDLVIRESDTSNIVSAYAPDGTLLFLLSPSPFDNLIDVVDLDNDGNAEIIGLIRGDGRAVAPVLMILDGFGKISARFRFPLGLTVAGEQVRVYQPARGNGKKRLVVAPNTFPNFRSAQGSHVWFFDAQLRTIAQPSVPPSCTSPSCSPEILTFPGVATGNIDASGAREIAVLAKSRILIFDEDGTKLYYRQFADSRSNSFTNYDPTGDGPEGSTLKWGGRRYGLFQLIDIDGDLDLEMVVAADANNIDNGGAGAVYEAYDLFAGIRSDGFERPRWRTWLPRANISYTPSGLPEEYKVGISLNGITDVNGDNIPDIVVTETAADGASAVRIINARTGSVSGPIIKGICLDVRRLDKESALADLIIYQGRGRHKVIRVRGPSYRPAPLPGDGTLAAHAAVLIKENVLVELTRPGYEQLGLTSEDGHFSLRIARSQGASAFVGYSPVNLKSAPIYCPAGLRSWSTKGGSVRNSLNMSTRPGMPVTILPGTDPDNSVWLINLENSCLLTNTARTAMQVGAELVPTGDF